LLELKLSQLGNVFRDYLPVAAVLAGTVFVMIILRVAIRKGSRGKAGYSFSRQLVTFVLVFAALIGVLITLPIRDSLRGQLFTLYGIIISALIALSSTTLIGNAMAGFMLRAVKSFKPGDFIQVNDFIGRLSEKGLFHIEIQTNTRDLITIPNQYLINNPTQVTRSDGTFIFADISLGYDVPRAKIEELLIRAAEETELKEPFVHIQDLGDFSIAYRVYGLLEDVKYLISARSNLKKNMLDVLHRHEVEIVSPHFRNQRVLPEERIFIPRMQQPVKKKPSNGKTEESAEDLAFDKAEAAETLVRLREKYNAVQKEIEGSKEFMKIAETSGEKEIHKQNIEELENRKMRLEKIISIKESKQTDN
jgi:small conductance mechanosensitive channel